MNKQHSGDNNTKRIIKNPQKFAQQGKPQEGGKSKESIVKERGSLEARVYFDPNEIKLHPGRPSTLLSGGFAWKTA